MNIFSILLEFILGSLLFNINVCDLFLVRSISKIAKLVVDITPHECEGFSEVIKIFEIVNYTGNKIGTCLDKIYQQAGYHRVIKRHNTRITQRAKFEIFKRLFLIYCKVGS